MNPERNVCVWSVSKVALAFLVIIAANTSHARAQAAKAEAPPLIVGTWKINFEKSGIRNPPPQVFQIRQYKLRDDGFLVGLLISGNAQGRVSFLQFTAKSDGKDYPEYTDDLLADFIASGKQPIRTYAERIIDDYVTEWVDKVNGKVTAQGKKTISKDGKTMTITNDNNPSQVSVWDRQ